MPIFVRVLAQPRDHFEHVISKSNLRDCDEMNDSFIGWEIVYSWATDNQLFYEKMRNIAPLIKQI